MTQLSAPNCNPALELMCIPECWELGLTGKGVGIGHLDTGVKSQHPCIEGRIAKYCYFDDDGKVVKHREVTDSGIHGTQTASLLCGQDGIGVAPEAQLYSGVVIEGGKSIVRVLNGLNWLLDQPIQVLCMALGIPYRNPIFRVILKRIRDAGVLPILPVGNFGEGIVCSPATDQHVLSVGATDNLKSIPKFSGSHVDDTFKHGFSPHMVAPGVDIIVANSNGGYTKTSGTSMASAYVAGIATLLFEAYPNATADEIEDALIESCQPLDGVPPHRSGYGLINAKVAYDYLRYRF